MSEPAPAQRLYASDLVAVHLQYALAQLARHQGKDTRKNMAALVLDAEEVHIWAKLFKKLVTFEGNRRF